MKTIDELTKDQNRRFADSAKKHLGLSDAQREKYLSAINAITRDQYESGCVPVHEIGMKAVNS